MRFTHKVTKEVELVVWSYAMSEDIYNIIEYNRQNFYKWLRFVKNIKSPENTEGLVKEALEGYISGLNYNLAILYKSKLVGNIVFEPLDTSIHKEGELSYWLDSRYESKGIMTNAVISMMSYYFVELDLNRISMRIARENLQSRKIPEKLNFTLEGVARESYNIEDQFQDICIYCMLKSEWAKLDIKYLVGPNNNLV